MGGGGEQTQEICQKDLPEAWKLLITSKVSNNLFSKVRAAAGLPSKSALRRRRRPVRQS